CGSSEDSGSPGDRGSPADSDSPGSVDPRDGVSLACHGALRGAGSGTSVVGPIARPSLGTEAAGGTRAAAAPPRRSATTCPTTLGSSGSAGLGTPLGLVAPVRR